MRSMSLNRGRTSSAADHTCSSGGGAGRQGKQGRMQGQAQGRQVGRGSREGGKGRVREHKSE